jgi:hypothetical protein
MTVAKRTSEHTEVTKVPSKNPKAYYFQDRWAKFGAARKLIENKASK